MLSSASTCDSIIVTTLTVNPLPTVTLDFNTLSMYGRYVCFWWTSLALTGGSPAGGVYSGSIVTLDSIYPVTLPVGATYNITYSYTDANSCTNTATDSVTVTVCEGIKENTDDNSISIYPNPTSGEFTITSKDKIESVKMYNVLGECVWQNSYHNVTIASIDFTGNISSPSGRSGGAGLYFVEIKTERGVVRKKVVKE